MKCLIWKINWANVGVYAKGKYLKMSNNFYCALIQSIERFEEFENQSEKGCFCREPVLNF